MTWSPEIVRPLGGVERTFALRWGELTRLETETELGALVLHRVVHMQAARRPHVEAIVRLGLLGGGLSDDKQVAALIADYVRGRPGAATEVLAAEILNHALFEPDTGQQVDDAPPSDAPGNPAPAGENATSASG